MTQRRDIAGLCLWGLVALALGAALALAGPVFAAAPPPRQAPLFEDEAAHQFVTNPVRMVLSVVGTSAAPATGRMSAVATVWAGQHPRVDAWDLTNPLTGRYSRISLGASTLVLNGLGAPGLGSALTQLATLQTGHYLDCWTLEDTDLFRALPPEILKVITDNTGLSTGNTEAFAHAFVLNRANFTSAKAFRSAVRTDITFTHLHENPERYRGQVVRAEGLLRRINRYDPNFEAAQNGVNDLYEAWIFPESLGSYPYCVQFTEWPAGLSRDLLGKDKIDQAISVRIDGYFFKKFRYQGSKNGGTREAPLVIGHTLRILECPDVLTETKGWVRSLVLVFLVIVAGIIFGVVGLTYWYRRSDNDIRRRLLRARSPEFVLPPPDAMPVAPLAGPMGRPLRGATTPPPRFDLPAERHERFERYREPGGGEAPDRPTEEGAGS
jgi:hypothetical protein